MLNCPVEFEQSNLHPILVLRPPAPVIRSSPFDVGALLNACIIIIIIISRFRKYSGWPTARICLGRRIEFNLNLKCVP